MLRIRLKVKFRAFFITFAEMDQTFPITLGVPVAVPPRVLYNDRGVLLEIL